MSLLTIRRLSARSRHALLIAVVLLVYDGVSHADCEPGKKCGASEVELSVQAMESFNNADAQLAQAFEAAMKRTGERALEAKQDPETWKSTLQRAQDAWRTYRDLTCGELRKQTYWGSGGAGSSLAGWDCLDQMTRARAVEVREYMH